MKKSELKQIIREEVRKTLHEVNKYDIMAVVSDIKRFNRNEFDMSDLVSRTLVNLEFKETPYNVKVIKSHFISSIENDKLPADATMVKELYAMLK